MNVDTDRVITEVRLRPELWDHSYPLYKDRDAKLRAWQEVCQATISNYDDLSDVEKKLVEKQVQQRWKTARDAYVRSKAILKSPKSGSGGGSRKKYIYYDCMQFLDKTQVIKTEDSILVGEQTQSYSGPDTIDTEEEGSLSNNDDESYFAVPLTTLGPDDSQRGQKHAQRKRKRCIENEDLEREMMQIFKENIKLMQNDDMSFFCSLLPITKTFSNHQKLRFRSDVLKVAMEISSTNATYSSNEDRPGSSQ